MLLFHYIPIIYHCLYLQVIVILFQVTLRVLCIYTYSDYIDALTFEFYIGSILEGLTESSSTSTSSMAVKPTKAPSMSVNTAYSDWKKQVTIWELTNATLGCNKTVLSGSLFEALTGQARDTVLSSLKIEQIVCEAGVKNILEQLDEFYAENDVKSAFTAQDELMSFRRKHGTNYKEFLVEFQLKANKVKLSGTELSDGVLGYTLLKCANLPQDKEELIRATCEKLDLKTVRTQLDKLSLNPSNTCDKMKFSVVKTEEQCSSSNKHLDTYYQNHSSHQSSSSDEDYDRELHDAYYGRHGNRPREGPGSNTSFKLNPLDRFKNVTQCDFCKCIYHWLPDCPYAPEDVKSSARRRIGNKHHSSYKHYKKPL